MIYLIIAFNLFFFSVTKKKKYTFLFPLLVIFLCFFASIRYGQGTDYFNYAIIYRAFSINFSDYFFYSQSVEPGYAFLSIIGNKFNICFELFVAILSIIHILLLCSVIKQYSYNPFFSVFIFFMNYYIPYFTNQWREGFALIWGLVVLFNYIKKRNKIFFFIQIILIGFTFHFSVFSLLLIPLFDKILPDSVIFSSVKVFIISLFCFIFSSLNLLFIPFLFENVHISIISKFLFYTKNTGYSIVSIGIRILCGFLIILLVSRKIKNDSDCFIKEMYRIYIYGLFLYLIMSAIPMFSRFSDYYSFIEVLLIPNLIYKKHEINKSARKILKIVMVSIYFILFIKDMNSAIYQGKYKAQSFYNYPYITIFDKNSIKNYREVPDEW